MRFIKTTLTILIVSLAAAAAGAAADKPQNGVEYQVLTTPQPAQSRGDQVEVIEFFSYCYPLCRSFDQELVKWAGANEGKVVFKRIPANLLSSEEPHPRMYYALTKLGKLDELHPKIFQAILDTRRRLSTDTGIADFMVSRGLDRKEFTDVYNSFSVTTKAKATERSLQYYSITEVPAVVVNGAYLTSPSMAAPGKKSASEAIADTLKVVEFLIDRSRKPR